LHATAEPLRCPAVIGSSRRIFFLVLLLASCQRSPAPAREAPARRPPNVLILLADDLGYADIGCYGQKKIHTPNLDALAVAGTRFTNAYSAAPVCAPSRCALLTGFHTGHSAIRDNKELAPEGQEPLPDDTRTLATTLREQGYATAFVGKWGLGPPGSSGDPQRHGFDHFFGYLCQRHAQNYYPSYLYRDGVRTPVPGGPGGAYSPDLMREEALAFLRTHAKDPFLLVFATTLPHVALQVPSDSLAEYKGAFPETPYDGSRGYLPHATPRAAYAAMVTRMDLDMGAILSAIAELGLERETLVVFTSDNGPTWAGGVDTAFFESTGGLRGLKGDIYEGGIRVPLIFRWPGHARAGGVSSFPCAGWDLYPTACAAVGIHAPSGIDGISLMSLLTGEGAPPVREHLYWEYPSNAGWQAVRIGGFKGVRRGAMSNPDGPIELYDLAVDPAESRNVAPAHADIVARMREIMAARTPSPIAEWNF
jgi:arylsulfatase